MNLRAQGNWTADAFGHWGAAAVGVVLVFAFVTGGGSTDPGTGDALTQLIALPLLVWAACALPAPQGRRLAVAAIAVALLTVITVAVQQLPLPEALWNGPAVRETLAADLRAAGVEPQRRWSLSPLASERALWSLLPALAVFLGVLAVPPAQQRRLLLAVVALAAASLLLGYLQLGAPQDSVLNPFPQWAPALNGFFANPNHQALSLALAVIAVAALLADDHGRDVPVLSRRVRFGLAALAVLMFASLPLAGSRAVLLIAVLALAAVPLLLRNADRRHTRAAAPVRTWIMRVALGTLAVAAIAAAIGWLHHDIAEEVRWSAAVATAAMGKAHAPWGAGVGSFVSWFDQAAPAALAQREYFNHAHDEFAQWWLESGVLGLCAALAAVAVLLSAFPWRNGAGRDHGIAVAAWLGCMAVLLHSLVDYPLRTPALMTTAALLAGIVVSRPRRRIQ